MAAAAAAEARECFLEPGASSGGDSSGKSGCSSASEEDGSDGEGGCRSGERARRLLLCSVCILAFPVAFGGLHRVCPGLRIPGLAPGPTTRPIRIVSVETLDLPTVNEVNHFTERFASHPGASFSNIGRGREWNGYKTKVELWRDYVRGRHEALGPEGAEEELVVLIDSRDLFWGGCDMETFQSAYEGIVARQGAPIVVGAELDCWEQNCSLSPDPPARVERGLWTEYIAGCGIRCGGQWRNVCSNESLNAERCTADWKTPEIRYLNSGFIMGPVAKVLPVLEWAFLNFDNLTAGDNYGDQTVFAWYWLHNQDVMTLDYMGELVMPMVEFGANLFSVDATAGNVHNNVLGRAQCFMHGSGSGKLLLGYLIYQLKPDWLHTLVQAMDYDVIWPVLDPLCQESFGPKKDNESNRVELQAPSYEVQPAALAKGVKEALRRLNKAMYADCNQGVYCTS